MIYSALCIFCIYREKKGIRHNNCFYALHIYRSFTLYNKTQEKYAKEKCLRKVIMKYSQINSYFWKISRADCDIAPVTLFCSFIFIFTCRRTFQIKLIFMPFPKMFRSRVDWSDLIPKYGKMLSKKDDKERPWKPKQRMITEAREHININHEPSFTSHQRNISYRAGQKQFLA